MIQTVYSDQGRLLSDILRLYNNYQPPDIDPCYNTGAVWRQVGLQPTWKFDITPRTEDTMQGDARSLPFDDNTVNCIYFDPPFMVGGNTGVMQERYSGFASIAELRDMYQASIREFQRILKPGGVLIVKCQDITYSHVNFPIHAELISMCMDACLFFHDLFVLLNMRNILKDKRIKNQIHARKSHSYMLVFVKGKYRLD